ncbi:MAG: sigma-54 dependent transcriptional regulator [Pseudomonadota bacterium]|nr:sigma-54 dependent transcriptional regulator [Pseudomonadota bacterium]
MNNHLPEALIVDDEPDLVSLLSITLDKLGIKPTGASDLAEAKEQIDRKQFDFCLTDMRLPDGNGLELIGYIQRKSPGTPVAVITAYGSAETAVKALKAGAFDFVAKPVELEQLKKIVQSALRLGNTGPVVDSSQILLGESGAIERIRTMVEKVSRSQAPVCVCGESGTGKELVARLIHELGPRATAPFIPINCGAIPAELMESEFFGHKKGSFSGAYAKKDGLFMAANGGTIFLDEIAELPLPLQVKLLRAIQEKHIRPVGSVEEIPVDVRIISATNRNLREMIQNESFREDLYYRVNVIQIDAPNLREHREDIPLLIDHFLHKLAASSGTGPVEIDPRALEELQSYTYPGNVRELENILERALALREGDTIRQKDLYLSQPSGTASPTDLSELTASIDEHLAAIEISLIRQALEQAGGNITEAAKPLRTTFRSLRYKIKKYGI